MYIGTIKQIDAVIHYQKPPPFTAGAELVGMLLAIN
tara:strand:+ start:1958 stop:2065 length:108 start_codon:yes stop_codon:yes gene_type:complete